MHQTTNNQSALRRLNGKGRDTKESDDDTERVSAQRTADEPSLLLTVDDVARLLKVSIRSVCRMRSAGHLPKAVNVLGSVRWRRTDIEAWVAADCPKRENSS